MRISIFFFLFLFGLIFCGEVIQLDSNNFEKIVGENDILINFYAPWYFSFLK